MYRYNRRKTKIKKIIFSIILFISISAGSIAGYEIFREDLQTDVDKNNSIEIQKISQEKEEKKEEDISQKIKKVLHTVVGISKIRNNGISIFGTDSISKLGIGTGVIISEEGYILTNEHVSGEKYSSCYITLENGNTVNGNVVWSDKNLDLAIVKINISGLESIEIGDSDKMEIAEEVYAIGNPIGVEFQRTVTKGIISGKDRTIKIEEKGKSTYMEDLIQTDATINPGNSGGPLINKKGEMIAINSVKITSAEGIGFSIPVNIIKPVIEKITQTGKFEEATLRNICIR